MYKYAVRQNCTTEIYMYAARQKCIIKGNMVCKKVNRVLEAHKLKKSKKVKIKDCNNKKIVTIRDVYVCSNNVFAVCIMCQDPLNTRRC